MHIGMMTTWDSICGIAEYSKNLVSELAKSSKVTIFANYGNIQHASRIPNVTIYKKQFGVFWWNEPVQIDVQNILHVVKSQKIDVFHIQYQSSLYEPDGFNSLLEELVNMSIPIVITLHDSSVNPHIKFPASVQFIAHNPVIGKRLNALDIFPFYMPFPILEIPSIVGTFGLGRNQVSIIQKVCNDLNLEYRYFDARKENRWKSTEELCKWIKECDVIVLWYNEVPGLEGNSSVVRTVVSCNRPLIVNDVHWFADVIYYADSLGLYVANNVRHLKELLRQVLHLPYKESCYFSEVVKMHFLVYNEILKEVTC